MAFDPPFILRRLSTCSVKPSPPHSRTRCHLAHWDLAMLSSHYIQKGLLFSTPRHLTAAAIIESLSPRFPLPFSTSSPSPAASSPRKPPTSRACTCRLTATVRAPSSSTWLSRAPRAGSELGKKYLDPDGRVRPIAFEQRTTVRPVLLPP